VWTVCVTLGFACWLFLDPVWTFVGVLLLGAASWVLISRKEWLAPVPRKQVIWIFVYIGLVVLVIIGLNLWWSGLKERGSDLEKWARSPAIVIPFWALVVGLKFLLWKRCRAACVQS
jgi:hypothetical protein